MCLTNSDRNMKAGLTLPWTSGQRPEIISVGQRPTLMAILICRLKAYYQGSALRLAMLSFINMARTPCTTIDARPTALKKIRLLHRALPYANDTALSGQRNDYDERLNRRTAAPIPAANV